MGGRYTWARVACTADLKRSSHSVCVVGERAYIFGGEIQPRQPVDAALHVVGLSTGEYERVDGGGDVPAPRVGHTAVVLQGEIYVFGGRGGPEMTPLIEHGAIHRYSPTTNLWSRLEPASPTPYPAARSYHASAAAPSHGLILVHAGCGDAATGRLNDLWAFDIATAAWSRLPDAPGEKGRGGTALAVLNDKVWRFGGFDGKTEIGGSIDSLELPGSTEARNLATDGVRWETIRYDSASGLGRQDAAELVKTSTGPGARSVAGMLPLGDTHLVTYFGEGKPSPTGGHDAAGNFWGDVWAFDTLSKTWQELSVQVQTEATGVPVESEGEGGVDGPGERGWFASDVVDGGLVVWGGIDSNNERLADGWIRGQGASRRARSGVHG